MTIGAARLPGALGLGAVLVALLVALLVATAAGSGRRDAPYRLTAAPAPSPSTSPPSAAVPTSPLTPTSTATATSVPAAVPIAMAVVVPLPAPPSVTTDCADALAYLADHQAPGFVDVCGPGSALGHLGYTCWNTAGACPDGGKVIHIACPAPFVYMNEAHNSWSLQGLRTGIDPYGQGSPAERAFCERLR